MLMQHIGVGYFGYYRATAYAMKHSLMPEIAKLRMKALNFWDKHGIRAAADAFDVSTRTLYWWRRLLRTGGPEALIPRSKAPLVRRSRHWHPDVLKEIRRLRTELPNLGKEQIFVRLKPWCEARHFTCPSTSTIGRIIAGAHDKMRMIPVRLSARGKARLIKKRSVKPRRPKQYRPVKTGELIGMDAIELRMGDLRRYIITMIDEHSDYALALAVPSLNSDITSHFFSKATKLFPVAIRQVVTDNGKEFLGNFDKTLQEASIKHIWTYPYTPKMNATCERFNRTLREQFIEFNELLLFEDLNLFNQRMAEYLVLYNSKRPHKSLELMTPVDYILRESKNCNMWWTHTTGFHRAPGQCSLGLPAVVRPGQGLPAFFLVEILEFLPVQRQEGFHHIAGRLRHQLKMQLYVAMCKGHVSHTGQAVKRSEKRRIKGQPLAVHRIRHPLIPLKSQQSTQTDLDKLCNTPGV